MILNQFFKYFIASGIAFIVDFSLLWILTDILKLYYILSATISFIIGLLTIYTISTKWVFSERKLENKTKEFIIFSLIGLVGVFINTLGIWLFTEKMHFHYLISKIVVTFFVFMWNFLVRKLVLF